jgi:hypothetical protein
MSQIDCSNVYVRTSSFSTPDNVFMGAFAAVDIMRGELVERGLVRRVELDGMKNPFVFTWSDDIPNQTWAVTSGCAMFYNTAIETDANTRMLRHFREDRFELFATRDIKAGEELTHRYKSLEWRTAFRELNAALSGEDPT